MMKFKPTRRDMLKASATMATASGFSTIGSPALAAARSVDVNPGDLPDLTIKEVRTYFTDVSDYHSLNGENGQVVSIVTNNGVEGMYTLGNRNATPGWLDWAKSRLLGKSVVDLLPTLASTSGLKGPYGFNGDLSGDRGGQPRYRGGMTFHERPTPGNGSAFDTPAVRGSGLLARGGGSWPNYYVAAADICMWDILGKTVNRPIYKLLGGGAGGAKDKIIAYASSTHHPAIEDYAEEVVKVKADNFKGYKIHPGVGAHRTGPAIPAYLGHMDEIRAVRQAAGDEFVLAHDPVEMYNRYEAMAVGRLLDELNYAWFEDPIRTDDTEGLIELCSALDLPVHVGEFIYSISDFAEYISRGALDVVRLIADNVGGISGSMRVGLLADAFGLECTPHNWGNPLDLAVHFHLELALPNSDWFELPYPASVADHPYMDIKYRPDRDGFIHAPTEPGLGVPIDRAEFDRRTKRIERGTTA